MLPILLHALLYVKKYQDLCRPPLLGECSDKNYFQTCMYCTVLYNTVQYNMHIVYRGIQICLFQ